MATWELELFPAAGGASTRQSLLDWGVTTAQIEFTNWGMDRAALTMAGGTVAFDAPQFEYKDKLVFWRDGVRFFHGWVTGLGLSAQPGESRQYTLSGPMWWLENLPFTWPFWPVKDSLDAGERASVLWLQTALDSAITNGAPIVRDAGFVGFTLPTPDLRASSNCAEVLRRVARLFPMSAGWWDYSGATPGFRASLRSGLTAQTVAIGGDVETLGFTPLPDLQLLSVNIAYAYDDGTGGKATVLNYAGTNPAAFGPNRLHCLVDVGSAELATEAANFGVAAILYAGLSPLTWSGAVNLKEGDTALPVIHPGHALSVTGGRSEWASMATIVQSTAWAITATACDTCTINLGAPEHLGPQDYLEFARAGVLAGGAGAGNGSPWNPPGPPTPLGDIGTPGTYDDLAGAGSAAPAIVLETRTIEATATLSGVDENPGYGSTPPRKFKSVTMSGRVNRYINGALSEWFSKSGTAVWNPATGAFSTMAEATVYSGGTTTTTQVSRATQNVPGGYSAPSPWFISSRTASYVATRQGSYSVAGVYILPASSDDHVQQWTVGTTVYSTDGQINETLGNEDTEDVAFARACESASWTEYSTSDKDARYQERTGTALSFTRRRLEWRVRTPENASAGIGWRWWNVELGIYDMADNGAGWELTAQPIERITVCVQENISGVIAPTAPVELDCPKGRRRRIALLTLTPQ